MELARETVIEDRRPRSVVVEVVGTGSTIDHIDRINFSHEEDGVLHLITKLLNTDCFEDIPMVQQTMTDGQKINFCRQRQCGEEICCEHIHRSNSDSNKNEKVKSHFCLAPNIMISTLVLSPAGLESLHLANGEERGFVAPPAFTFGNPLMATEKATREKREPK